MLREILASGLHSSLADVHTPVIITILYKSTPRLIIVGLLKAEGGKCYLFMDRGWRFHDDIIAILVISIGRTLPRLADNGPFLFLAFPFLLLSTSRLLIPTKTTTTPVSGIAHQTQGDSA